MPTFPSSGGAIKAPNTAQIYVDPNGSDTATGLLGDPVKTGYVGYQKIVAAGGGYLYVATGISWGGPIPGQGIYFRNDTLAQLPVPGFLPDVPCRVIAQGPGQQSAYQQKGFQQAGCALIHAGSNKPEDYRTKPGLWMVSTKSQITFENIQIVPAIGFEGGFNEGVNQAFRWGWDYPRSEDGSIAYQAVTGAARTGTAPNATTVYNVALTPAVSCTHAARVSNVTTLTIPRPGHVDGPPYSLGTEIYFTSSDPGTFPSGTYTITAMFLTGLAYDNWSVSFSDPGADADAVNTGTIRTTGVYPGQLIDLQSTDSNFVSTQYTVLESAVLSPSTGTVTVADPYGSTHSTASPVGQFAAQIRDVYACVPGPAPNMINCSSRMNQDPSAAYYVGPMMDFGGSVAFSYKVTNSYVQGYFPDPDSGIAYDYQRSSAIVAIGGPAVQTGLNIANMTGHQASAVFEPVGPFVNSFTSTNVLWDSNGTGICPATYIVNGNAATTVSINDTLYSDANAGYGDDARVISGVPGINIGGNSVGGYVQQIGLSAVGPAANAMSFSSSGPWDKLTIGTWGNDGAITGKHPASYRPNISPANRRFPELARTVSGYLPEPTATGKPDPNGLSAAFEYDDSLDGTYGSGIIIYSFDAPFTFQPGDYIVVKGWINSIGLGLVNGGSIAGVHGFGTLEWETGGDSWLCPVPNTLAGWQCWSFKNKIKSASGSQNLQVIINRPPHGFGGKLQFLEWNIEYIPAASVASHDAAEHAGAYRASPHYLPVGAAGTWPGQVFYGDGGFGATPLTKTVTTDTGKVVPFYNPDGTLMGYINIVNAT